MSLVNKKGVDISSWQEDIDLSKVKSAGYEWVMIRVGQGTRITDSFFERNVQKAAKLGMPWGVYLLTEATTTAAAQAEVEFTDKMIKAQIAKGYKPPTLPIAIDIEEAGFSDSDYNSSVLTIIASVWVNEMKKRGYYPMIYTGFYDIRDLLSTEVVNSCDIWLAEWGRYPDYQEANLGMWQFSDGATDLVEFKPLIPGVGIAVDKNICYKDYPTIIKNGGFNGWAPANVLDTTGFKYLDKSTGVLALKEMLLLAKKLGITTQGMQENTTFGDGTQIAVNQVLKKGGYDQNGIAGEKFIKFLAKLIREKLK